jgi:hypothetical protein
LERGFHGYRTRNDRKIVMSASTGGGRPNRGPNTNVLLGRVDVDLGDLKAGNRNDPSQVLGCAKGGHLERLGVVRTGLTGKSGDFCLGHDGWSDIPFGGDLIDRGRGRRFKSADLLRNFTKRCKIELLRAKIGVDRVF